MISLGHTQEALSRAYIQAVAGSAGINCNLGREFDYGFDGTFRQVVSRGGRLVESGNDLDFQLKCTVDWSFVGNHIKYTVKTKTYNDIVSRGPGDTGAILIVMCLPSTKNTWVNITENRILIRKCCYFTYLSGEIIPNENSTKLIFIPRANLLTADAVSAALAAERVRRYGQL